MNNLFLIFIIINIIINVSFFISFELSKPSVREFIPLAVICSFATLGRMVFSFIPQVQPVTVLVIISASVFGMQRGFITGSICAIISNMFLGQGPWTLYQMTAWGTVGLISGFIGKFFKNQKNTDTIKKSEILVFSVFSFVAAFIFSIICDLSTISYLKPVVSLNEIIAVFATGIFFNITHAVFNVLLVLCLYAPLKKRLLRC